jgi:hypothetical protein
MWCNHLRVRRGSNQTTMDAKSLSRRSGLACRLHLFGTAQLIGIASRMENHRDTEIVGEVILRYLDAHADAADTVEGIARWWVLRQRYDESLAAVERAVVELERRNLVKRSVLPDGTVLYSRR